MNESHVVIAPHLIDKQYYRDVWKYRELFAFLAWRDILVRYKQTTIGVLWAIVRPFLTMVVFSIVFGKIAQMPSGGVPYPILVFVGMLPWQFFSNSVAESSSSLLSNSAMISKIYFPRLIIPTSTIIVSFIDFLISFLILILIMAYYRFVPSINIVFLPIFVVHLCLAACGVGLWLSALAVKYRDFRYVVPFIVQFGLYISPVGFASSVVPDKWKLLYSLNPMVGSIDGFRWSILGNSDTFDSKGFLLSSASVVILFITGLRFFRTTEKIFADVI